MGSHEGLDGALHAATDGQVVGLNHESLQLGCVGFLLRRRQQLPDLRLPAPVEMMQRLMNRKLDNRMNRLIGWLNSWIGWMNSWIGWMNEFIGC